jgi:hypothetical protein
MKKTDKQQLEEYLAFLQKRLSSENYKGNVSKEEYEKEKSKYDKAKTRFKLLYGKK